MTNNIYLKTNLELIEYLNSRFSDESLFIIDSNLNNLKIDEQVNARVSYFDINEETKNLTSVEKIWDLLFQHNLNKPWLFSHFYKDSLTELGSQYSLMGVKI